LNLATGVVEAVVAVGDRPSGVGITPDGTQAVVANLDSTFASVIDLASFTVTNVPISTRGSEVAIAPDGSYAYVAVVASGDGVWRIDLSSLTTAGPKLVTGNMGSVGFLFTQSSGLALSPDGGTLAVCGSFDDRVTLIDTASWSVAANVAVGDFPTRALFSGDGATVWVSNRDSDSVSVVSNVGGASRVTGTIAVGDFPFELAASGDERFLYVGNVSDDSIGVICLARGAMVETIPVSGGPQGLVVDGNCLYVTSGTFGAGFFFIVQEGVLDVVDLVSRRVVDSLATGLPPGEIGFSAAVRKLWVPSPFGDGLTAVTVD
jgi:YVTN family beta-propeller protein